MTHRSDHPSRLRGAGFTLLELLIVLAILGLLAALVVPKLGGKVVDAQVRTTEVQIVNLSNALEQFGIDVGRYPSTSEGLAALVTEPAGLPTGLWNGPYLQQNVVPTDSWKNSFVYENNSGQYVIRSLGADGAVGGTGANADLDNLGS